MANTHKEHKFKQIIQEKGRTKGKCSVYVGYEEDVEDELNPGQTMKQFRRTEVGNFSFDFNPELTKQGIKDLIASMRDTLLESQGHDSGTLTDLNAND